MIAIPGLDALPLPGPAPVLAHLGRASISGGLFVAAVWALTRALPRLPPALRCGLWWAAGLKLLVALVWVAPFGLALLPAPVLAADPTAAASAPGAPAEARPDRGVVQASGPTGAVSSGAAPTPAAALLGSALGALGLAHELRSARRLRRASRPASDPSLAALVSDLRRRLGVRTAVELRLSDRVPGPLTLGLLRPAVVLPERDLARLSREELEMALGHELLHVRGPTSG
jgi:beta-lactamase regulating signal transducer with metallopeptidase domain